MKAACTVTISGHIEEWPQGFSDALPVADWLAVLAPPRQDKLLCSGLRIRRIPGLMFYERRTRRYAKKGVQEYLVPLLGAWAFVHAADRDRIWETERVARILPVRREDLFVRELGDLIALLRRGGGPPVVNPGLVVGTRVRITRGAMAGLCGVVQRRRDHTRLMVSLTALGTTVSVELPADAAEAWIEEPEAPAQPGLASTVASTPATPEMP